MRMLMLWAVRGLVLLAVGLSVAGVTSSAANAQRRVSEEALLFRKWKGGVCTVFSGSGHGSGFLVDTLGIVLTNDHVVGKSTRIRVLFNDSTRVEAVVAAVSSAKDVAVLRVHPSVVVGYPVLRLATESDTMVYEGEKVIAIGSPLNQDKIMTAGIISKVEEAAVMSDVNINPGNSGGPLINMNGEVIAINTFGDVSEGGGPGVSGSITITEAREVLKVAMASLDTTRMPSPRRLPVVSNIPFPIDSLKDVAKFEDFDEKAYRVPTYLGTGKFDVTLVTPPFAAWRSWKYSVELNKRSKKREQKGGDSEAEGVDPMRQMREWMQYASDDYAPVVTVQCMPQVGETAGSMFGNILGAVAAGAAGTGYRGSYRYEYKADFLRAEVYRESVLTEDLNMFVTMIPRVFATDDWSGRYSMEDQARSGIVLLDPSVFAPVEGRSPKISMKVWSVEKPNKPYEFELPKKTVDRVWADFKAWRVEAGLEPRH